MLRTSPPKVLLQRNFTFSRKASACLGSYPFPNSRLTRGGFDQQVECEDCLDRTRSSHPSSRLFISFGENSSERISRGAEAVQMDHLFVLRSVI